MTYDEFVRSIDFGIVPGNQRQGQWFYNLLSRQRPDLAQRLIAMNLDPFYNDAKIPDALTWLRDHWSQPPGYDPTTAIGSIRAYVGIILEPSSPDDTDTFETAARLLAQQVRTLDQWLKDGGSAPEDWGVM